MGTTVWISEDVKNALEEIKKEYRFTSIGDAIKLATQVLILAKEAKILVVTGGFPLLRRFE